ncbi:MAG: hypothetical protein RR721_16750, partial [Aeromonas sp.]|uniref:hypothetical protein n=2 Tax=Aeromonas sp. TaxID=647 RepID=UPI002FCBB4DB
LFEAPTGLFALPLALSMEAHYRELSWDDKGFFVIVVRSLRYASDRYFFAQNAPHLVRMAILIEHPECHFIIDISDVTLR